MKKTDKNLSGGKKVKKGKKIKDIIPNTFWNSCPRGLKRLPCVACPLGQESIKLREPKVESCKWGINDKKANFCFWKYIQKRSDPKTGIMDPKLQSDVAKLMSCSSTKIHFIEKTAFEKLKDKDALKFLKSLK